MLQVERGSSDLRTLLVSVNVPALSQARQALRVGNHGDGIERTREWPHTLLTCDPESFGQTPARQAQTEEWAEGCNRQKAQRAIVSTRLQSSNKSCALRAVASAGPSWPAAGWVLPIQLLTWRGMSTC